MNLQDVLNILVQEGPVRCSVSSVHFQFAVSLHAHYGPWYHDLLVFIFLVSIRI